MFAKSKVILSAGIVLTASATAVARDDAPPTIDLPKVCRASQTAVGAIYGTSPSGVFDTCMSGEKAAREQLVKSWSTFSASDKALCVQPMQFNPSYIEWLTCAEMQRDVRNIRKDQPASGPSGASMSGNSRTRQCPIVQLRSDGSIASVIAC
jgi:hypothetical protein